MTPMIRRYRRAIAQLFGVAALTLWAPFTLVPALASEESELLVTQGLFEFNEHNYESALDSFEKAVAIDGGGDSAANTPTKRGLPARYYRGVTLGRLGRNADAEADLRAVYGEWPENRQVQLELGIVLVTAALDGCSDEAEALLTASRMEARLVSASSFFLGVCHLRTKQYDVAAGNFERALATDQELRLAVSYYLGLVKYRTYELGDAEDHFETVIRLGGNSPMAREAAGYLELIRTTRRYSSPFVSIGLEYDSNVSLSPSENAEAVTLSDKGDGRVTITAGGRYTIWRQDRIEVELGYEFYQSLHFDLDEFNLQNHRPSLAISSHYKWAQLGVDLRYDYHFLDGDSLLQQPSASPWLRVDGGKYGTTDVFYRFRWRDYVDGRFSKELDALRHTVGVRHYFSLTGDEVEPHWIGYTFDRNGAVHSRGRSFAYDRHEVGLGTRHRFSSTGIVISGSYRFHDESYDSPSKHRRDQRHTFLLGAYRGFWEWFEISCGYRSAFNKSNKGIFDYQRHIASVAITARF